MTRLLRVYSGSDSSPIIDYTDDVNWVEAELASMAHDGESAVGQIGIYDPDGVIPDSVPPGKFLNSHNVVLVEDGPYRLFRGRINTRASSRRMRRGRRTKYINCNVGDYNQDLRGIVVDNWVRPLESNIARVQALAAAYLAGSPRATTNLNATTYVSGSNALTIPAKTYTGMYVGDVLADIAREAGKIFFVTIDGELFYDGSESTAYASSLRISDDVADANATTYAPQWHAGDASTEDGIDTASHIRSYYGTESSVTANTGQQAYNDYWETLWWDPLAEVESNATPRAVARLQEVQDTLTVSCTIGPIPWAQLGSIKAGQTIQFKARAARGGRGPTGTFLGDSFVTLRIAELRWKMPEPMTYFAVLQLSKPPRIGPYGTGSQAQVTANAALNLAEGTDATLTLGSDISTEWFELHDNTQTSAGTMGTWTAVANAETDCGVDLVEFVNLGCGSRDLWWGQRVYYTGLRTQSALPANNNYLGLELEIDLQMDRFSLGLRGGGSGGVAPVKGPHLVTAGFTGSTFSTTDIGGGVPVATLMGNTTTKTDIKIFIPSGLVPWGSVTRFVFQPMFRAQLQQLCDETGLAEDLAAGLGTATPRDATLKPITVASAGWVTGGIVGTQNGINASFTLVGGWGDVAWVSVNGLNLPLDDVDLSSGTPNIVFKGWAPLATDLVMVRYRVP